MDVRQVGIGEFKAHGTEEIREIEKESLRPIPKIGRH